MNTKSQFKIYHSDNYKSEIKTTIKFEIYNNRPQFKYQLPDIYTDVGTQLNWRVPNDLAFDEDGDKIDFSFSLIKINEKNEEVE